MLFSSILFLFTFLPVTLILYYLAPGKLKNVVLLAASLVFYAWGEPVFIFLMIFSILFNYISGLDVARNLGNAGKARKSLVFNIVVNMCILGFFKYEGFLLGSLNAILPVDIPYRELPLPIGISFYTFQTLSYVIDVYRGNVRVQRSLLDFALYVTMFPQLIAGPIVKYADIARQLRSRSMGWGKFGDGVMYFIRGLSKKVLLANTIGMVFNDVAALGAGETSALSAWLGCAAYTFQIYFDFSGYSDMAIGLGKMFGFEFRPNFNYPYISRNITEFWRRWHISLSTWFKEYVYIPLGGNRVSPAKHIRNIMAVWLLTGLWHGAAWNFVFWGLYYGILLLIEKYFLSHILAKLPGVVEHLYSLVLVMIGWVFFFSPTLGDAFGYLGLMAGSGCGLADRQGLYLLVSNGPVWVLLILCSTPVLHRAYEKLIYGGKRERIRINALVYLGLFLLCIAYLVTESYNPFLYFRF